MIPKGKHEIIVLLVGALISTIVGPVGTIMILIGGVGLLHLIARYQIPGLYRVRKWLNAPAQQNRSYNQTQHGCGGNQKEKVFKKSVQTADPWIILGINRSASRQEIKSAYRKLIFIAHPDRGGNASQFRDIERSYKIVLDSTK